MGNNGATQPRAIQKKRWVLAPPPPPELVRKFCGELKIPEPIGVILLQRGIDDFEKARRFFRPSMEHLHDPFLMDGMEEATARILSAVNNGERICVYGDYDVDGTNGAAMLYLFLREAGGSVSYYIPDRIREGYGISIDGVNSVHRMGATLLLSVDCGITAVSQADHARSLGIDLVICDHHKVGKSIPAASAVLDPLKPDDAYPFKGLCGCGVAFKLIQALARRLGREDVIPTYLDFVTLATAADIVPMNDENRVLMKLGLETLNRNPRPGVKALIESAGMTAGRISTGQIVFALAPRINAVGRLGDAMRAVKLLIADNETEGESLARVLEEENRNRRRIDEETFAQAQQMVDGFDDIGNLPAIVLHSPGWHPGVIGIVASRIVEKYYKPSIMLATVDGAVKGSARSVPGFDMYDALKMCEDTMIQFGGHKYAAGLTLDESRVDDFRQAFTAAVGQTMPEELKVPSVRIDVELGLGNLSPRFLRILKEFAPFGPGNPRPVFLARNLEVIGKPRIVGRNHLRFRVRQEGVVFDAIGFDLGSLLPEILQTQGRNNLACVFSLDETEVYSPGGGWEGDPIPQLKIRDLRQETDAEGLSMQ